MSEKKDNASTADISGGVQMLEKVSTNTFSSEESEAEKVLQAELSLRTTFADAREIITIAKNMKVQFVQI